jgi:hypothetical protein
VAPLSGEVRWTKRVARPASAAVAVKISRIVRATCGIVVIRVAGVFVRKYTLRRYSFFFKEIKEKPIEFSTSS